VNADYRILLVDDDEDILWANKMILSGEGFTVDVSTDPEEALEKIKSEEYNIFIIDYMMPKIKGDELAYMILAQDTSVGIIFLTGYSEYAEYMKMVGNVDDFILFKPISRKELIDAVNSKIIQMQGESDVIANPGAVDFRSSSAETTHLL
jgi:two-component system response regulator VanR